MLRFTSLFKIGNSNNEISPRKSMSINCEVQTAQAKAFAVVEDIK